MIVLEAVVTLGSSTESSPDFYKDEPLVLSCQTENKPTGPHIYGIAFADGGDEPDITGCTITGFNAQAVPTTPADVTLINGIDNDMCEKVKTDSLWNMQLSVRIVSELTKYTMSCRYQDQVTAALTVSQNKLKINTTDIKGKI